MQRFRIMNAYSIGVIVLLACVIGGVTWLRRPAGNTAEAGPGAPSAPAAQPVESSAGTLASRAQEFKISIDNFAFKPKELSVPVGATVTWVNHDDVPHTSTGVGNPAAWDSKALDTDDKFSVKFTKPGTYSYYCKVHTHMTGKVIVK